MLRFFHTTTECGPVINNVRQLNKPGGFMAEAKKIYPVDIIEFHMGRIMKVLGIPG